jgi:hypothetical protein
MLALSALFEIYDFPPILLIIDALAYHTAYHTAYYTAYYTAYLLWYMLWMTRRTAKITSIILWRMVSMGHVFFQSVKS